MAAGLAKSISGQLTNKWNCNISPVATDCTRDIVRDIHQESTLHLVWHQHNQHKGSGWSSSVHRLGPEWLIVWYVARRLAVPIGIPTTNQPTVDGVDRGIWLLEPPLPRPSRGSH